MIEAAWGAPQSVSLDQVLIVLAVAPLPIAHLSGFDGRGGGRGGFEGFGGGGGV